MECEEGETEAAGGGGSHNNNSIIQGGPLYFDYIVSSPTTPIDFQHHLLQELHLLRLELSSFRDGIIDDDISVDDLKAYRDEDLVDVALKETLHNDSCCDNDDDDNVGVGSSLQSDVLGRKRNAGKTENGERKTGKRLQGPTTLKETSSRLPNRRRGRRVDVDVDESYLAKVDRFVKIKEKQDVERVETRLHSLTTNHTNAKVGSSSLDKSKRMKSHKLLESWTRVKSWNVIESSVAVVHQPEVVLCVEIYDCVKKHQKMQAFWVVGQQKLTELRDKINCLTDKVMQKADQHDPSGYFLVEDVFYNDLRDKAAIDYSVPIFDWLENSKADALRKWESIVHGDLQKMHKEIIGDGNTPPLPHFRRVKMEETRFCDLRFCLGAGYLYCHQGNCRHTIVIRDMRLIHPEDVQDRAAYPIVFQRRFLHRKCDVCRLYRATKVTVDDKLALHNPCYFCNHCYFLLHYVPKDNTKPEDGDYRLLYDDFLVYDYVHY